MTSIITFVCIHSGVIRTGDNLSVGSNAVTVESIEQEGRIVDSVSASDWAVITLKGNTVDQIQEVSLFLNLCYCFMKTLTRNLF